MMGRKDVFRMFVAALPLSLLVVFSSPALSEYPKRPITVYGAFDPDTPSDLISRATATGAEKQLSKPLIFENRAGGGGSVALAVTANAKPDGYILCAGPNLSVVDTALRQKVSYKPLRSFTPIIGSAMAEHSVLLVRNDAPWKTFQEFLDYVKKNPGKMKYSACRWRWSILPGRRASTGYTYPTKADVH